jgi:NAD(P)H-flavin reductase
LSPKVKTDRSPDPPTHRLVAATEVIEELVDDGVEDVVMVGVEDAVNDVTKVVLNEGEEESNTNVV